MKGLQCRSGQAIMELLLGLGLVLLPTMVAGGYVLRTDWEKSKCVYQSFQAARAQLITTRALTTEDRTCGEIRDVLTLVPLEDLDQDKGTLDIGDLIAEASHFWEQFSSWQSSPSLSDFSRSD